MPSPYLFVANVPHVFIFVSELLSKTISTFLAMLECFNLADPPSLQVPRFETLKRVSA